MKTVFIPECYTDSGLAFGLRLVVDEVESYYRRSGGVFTIRLKSGNAVQIFNLSESLRVESELRAALVPPAAEPAPWTGALRRLLGRENKQ